MTRDLAVAVRVALAALLSCALLTLGLAGLAAPWLVLAGVGLFAISTWTGAKLSSDNDRTLRSVLSGGLLLIPLVAMLAGVIQPVSLLPAMVLVPTAGAGLLSQRVPRDALVNLLLAFAMLLAAAGLSPRPAIVPGMLLSWACAGVVVALLAEWRATAGTAAVMTVTGARQAPVSRMWMATAAAVVAGLVTFLILPTLTPRDQHARDSLSQGRGGDPATSTDRSASAYATGLLDMRARGSLSDTPVLDVPADSPGLWRSAVLDRYEGGLWARPNGEFRPFTATASTAKTRTDEVHPLGAPYLVVIAPGDITAVDTQAAIVSSGEQLFWTTERGALSDYRVTSAVRDGDPALLHGVAVVGGTPPPDDGRSLALPEEMTPRVLDLGASLAGSAADRFDAVRSVETYLRKNERYRLDSPVPGPGTDPVDAFLFTDHVGFCEQFAAAEVILLRAARIPARMATGFSGGVADGDRRLLRESDAHAWVEVWFPERGWVSSDPTAGAQLAAANSAKSLLERFEELLRSQLGRLLLAGVILALVAVGGGIAWLLRRRRQVAAERSSAGADERHRGHLLAAFQRLEAALDAVGTPRAPGETVAELAERLVMRGAGGPTLASALRTVEQFCYDRGPVPAEATLAAAVELDRFAAELYGLLATRPSA